MNVAYKGISIALLIMCTFFTYAISENYNPAKNNFTIQLQNMKSHYPGFSDQDCQYKLKPSYAFQSNQRKLFLNDQMIMSLASYDITEKNNIFTFSGVGTWEGKSPQGGKVFEDPTYFSVVGVAGSNHYIGVLSDSHCHGDFILNFASQNDKTAAN